MIPKPVQYARNGSVRLAFRMLGEPDAPPLIFVPGWVSNVDDYDDPTNLFAVFAETIAVSTRFIVWDERGTGLSDPVDSVPTLDERMDDLRAVMDAAGVDQASLMGGSEGGPMSVLFAATYPQRLRSLVLLGTAPRFSCDPPSFPWGFTRSEIEAQMTEIDERWGEGALADLFLGPIAEIAGVRELFGRAQRRGASPTMGKYLWQALMEIGVRDVLGSVEAPTLVFGRAGDQIAPLESARAMAAAIPNAIFAELLPGDHLGGDPTEAIPTVLDFVIGAQPTAPATHRTLATVLFTDIVGSTEALTAQGDKRCVAASTCTTRSPTGTSPSTAVPRSRALATESSRSSTDRPRRRTVRPNFVPALATRNINIRAGVHTGECERRGDDWSGVGVHIGYRVAALAGSGEVLASRTVRDLSAGST